MALEDSLSEEIYDESLDSVPGGEGAEVDAAWDVTRENTGPTVVVSSSDEAAADDVSSEKYISEDVFVGQEEPTEEVSLSEELKISEDNHEKNRDEDGPFLEERTPEEE